MAKGSERKECGDHRARLRLWIIFFQLKGMPRPVDPNHKANAKRFMKITSAIQTLESRNSYAMFSYFYLISYK